MSYVLTVKEKKLLQTENFQSLGWVKFRPFKSRISTYHKSQLFFRTGEKFKPSNKFYALVYLFSDNFQKDGRDFQMKVFVKVPTRFIWASEKSKRVSIIVPTNFKFYTTVKVYDPLHLQMVKGLELNPEESYPVEKIARKGYWGKVYPHSKENYEKVYNTFTEKEKANANLRVLDEKVEKPKVTEKLKESKEIKKNPFHSSYVNEFTNDQNLNNQMDVDVEDIYSDISKKQLELEKQLQEQLDDQLKSFSENQTNIENTNREESLETKKEEENSYETEYENENYESDSENEKNDFNEYEEYEENETNEDNEYDSEIKRELLQKMLLEKKMKEKLKLQEKSRHPLTEPTPESEREYENEENEIIEPIDDSEINVAIDEKFVDDFKVDTSDGDFVKEYQEYDPIDVDEDFEDIDENLELDSDEYYD